MQKVPSTVDATTLLERLRGWARELGFSQIAVADVDLSSAEPGLQAWLDAGHHGRMHYMEAHGMKRARPAELVPGTLRVVTARMDYLPQGTQPGWQAVEWAGLDKPEQAQISIYARGRDYHKVLRNRLQKLAEKLAVEVGPLGYRVFTDSAPVLEVELASRSGLGWRGKHTLTLHRDAGSMFFLGELFIDLALPLTEPVGSHCGECTACLAVCPTAAITAPYRVDARRCISYLTIEHDGPIPLELRHLLGNRVYGCDDCQLACPWNKFAQAAVLVDFDVRPGMAGTSIAELLDWDEAEFLRRTEGSAIRRIGFLRWQRNLAVAAGNALRRRDDAALRAALMRAIPQADALVAEHVEWALSAPPSPPPLSSSMSSVGAPA
ncbi:MAG: tRNA epoxyqueuosine(34) reductase QueG [Rubrivivax sp.]|nr:MAG: tRNA epoxyqueuosine(34) reductase QueG [Rubrivivax sp.]